MSRLSRGQRLLAILLPCLVFFVVLVVVAVYCVRFHLDETRENKMIEEYIHQTKKENANRRKRQSLLDAQESEGDIAVAESDSGEVACTVSSCSGSGSGSASV
eukprot:Amastigsp_a353855_15.p2 type:complete len:103 gc:universal Amastigsp_a353855_15:33-341(+)